MIIAIFTQRILHKLVVHHGLIELHPLRDKSVGSIAICRPLHSANIAKK